MHMRNVTAHRVVNLPNTEARAHSLLNIKCKTCSVSEVFNHAANVVGVGSAESVYIFPESA